MKHEEKGRLSLVVFAWNYCTIFLMNKLHRRVMLGFYKCIVFVWRYEQCRPGKNKKCDIYAVRKGTAALKIIKRQCIHTINKEVGRSQIICHVPSTPAKRPPPFTWFNALLSCCCSLHTVFYTVVQFSTL